MISINKKIALSALSIVTALSLMGGATYAFFTDTETSSNNTMSTGTLSIALDQSGSIFESSAPITNWQPGEERFVRFDTINNGSLPVNLRAFAVGEWGDTLLDENLVKIVNVEYWDGSGWADIINNPSGITGIVYWSPNGLDVSNFILPAGDTQEFRLTVKLDESADNTYQNKTFNSKIQVHAKQTTPSATWPAPTVVTVP